MNLHGDDTHGLRVLLDAFDTHHIVRLLIPKAAYDDKQKKIKIFHRLKLKIPRPRGNGNVENLHLSTLPPHEIPSDINVRTCDACLYQY